MGFRVLRVFRGFRGLEPKRWWLGIAPHSLRFGLVSPNLLDRRILRFSLPRLIVNDLGSG